MSSRAIREEDEWGKGMDKNGGGRKMRIRDNG
jgi:hypothetical protein